MGATTLNLDIFGSRIQVICEDPDGVDLLRSALSAHLVEEEAPLGFVVRPPRAGSRLHVLLDRSGFVLGRTRSTEEALNLLGSHLAVFVPPPSDTIRIRARALIGQDSSAKLAIFSLFTDPPLIERRLTRESHRIIDRLAIDITPEANLHMSPAPWPELADLPTPDAHVPMAERGAAITGILAPQVGKQAPSGALVVSQIASALAPASTHVESLDMAELIRATRVTPVRIDDRSAQYRGLRQMTGEVRET